MMESFYLKVSYLFMLLLKFRAFVDINRNGPEM